MTTPELQITNASSITGYTNFLRELSGNYRNETDDAEISGMIEEMGLANANISVTDMRNSFTANYSNELALADNPTALLNRLDLLLTYGSLMDDTRQRIIEAVNQIVLNDSNVPEAALQRVHQTVLMVMTSPEYLVQQ